MQTILTALAALDIKRPVATARLVSFEIAGCPRFNAVLVVHQGGDRFSVEFSQLHGDDGDVVGSVEGLRADQLAPFIASFSAPARMV